MTLVKICCIASIEEARMAARYGASAIGLVTNMPSGPGVIDEGTIARILRLLPPALDSFLLTSLQDAEAIVSQWQLCPAKTLQLCRPLPTSSLEELRSRLPDVALVQAVHVRDMTAIQEARETAPFVDALLLDSGDPTRPRPELGGTGRSHDWTISQQVCRETKIPVYLAGGLHPGNVAEAIRIVRPFAVDVCSGVRREGHLDESLLAAFVQQVHVAAPG